MAGQDMQMDPMAELAVDLTPGIGDIKALAYDAPREFRAGNLGMAALAAGSAIPILGEAFQMLRGARKVQKAASVLTDAAQGNKLAEELGALYRRADEGKMGLKRTERLTPGEEAALATGARDVLKVGDREFPRTVPGFDAALKASNTTGRPLLDLARGVPYEPGSGFNPLRTAQQQAIRRARERWKMPVEALKSETGAMPNSAMQAMYDWRAKHPRLAQKIQQEIEEGLMDSPEQLAAFRANVSAKNGWARAMRNYALMPDPNVIASAALAGANQYGWYRTSGKALGQVFGTDAPRFVGLLAATSPRVSVEDNLRIAMNFWENWEAAGRPKITKKNVNGFMPFLKEVEIALEEGEDVATARRKAMESWQNNIMRVLNPEDETFFSSSLADILNNPYDEATGGLLGGSKVDAFFANLMGETKRATQDAWMARLSGVDQGRIARKGVFWPLRAVYKRAADEIATRTGQSVDVANVQEMAWSFTRALGEILPKNPTAEQVDDAIDLLMRGQHTAMEDWITNADPFSQLLANSPDARRVLDRMGAQVPDYEPIGLPNVRGQVRRGELEQAGRNIAATMNNRYNLGIAGAAGAGALARGMQQNDPRQQGIGSLG